MGSNGQPTLRDRLLIKILLGRVKLRQTLQFLGQLGVGVVPHRVGLRARLGTLYHPGLRVFSIIGHLKSDHFSDRQASATDQMRLVHKNITGDTIGHDETKTLLGVVRLDPTDFPLRFQLLLDVACRSGHLLLHLLSHCRGPLCLPMAQIPVAVGCRRPSSTFPSGPRARLGVHRLRLLDRRSLLRRGGLRRRGYLLRPARHRGVLCWRRRGFSRLFRGGLSGRVAWYSALDLGALIHDLTRRVVIWSLLLIRLLSVGGLLVILLVPAKPQKTEHDGALNWGASPETSSHVTRGRWAQPATSGAATT
mmetsp:Transcript_51896/g.118293  ORF Transcript_51896/g.118293 Transcript_51896/m.118293 type:complete len:307 (-) Transcript_51896:3-923(-)